jgi:hypothetical protein
MSFRGISGGLIPDGEVRLIAVIFILELFIGKRIVFGNTFGAVSRLRVRLFVRFNNSGGILENGFQKRMKWWLGGESRGTRVRRVGTSRCD